MYAFKQRWSLKIIRLSITQWKQLDIFIYIIILVFSMHIDICMHKYLHTKLKINKYNINSFQYKNKQLIIMCFHRFRWKIETEKPMMQNIKW